MLSISDGVLIGLNLGTKALHRAYKSFDIIYVPAFSTLLGQFPDSNQVLRADFNVISRAIVTTHRCNDLVELLRANLAWVRAATVAEDCFESLSFVLLELVTIEGKDFV